MAIKITNTRQAQKVVASQKSKQTLGKKLLELGKEYVLLFPKRENEVAVAGIVGRNCNYNELNISFCRIADSQMVINEETQRIKDNSGMQRWANLSNILYSAAMRKEIQEKEEEAKKVAEQTSSKIDEGALAQAIDKIKVAYEGKKKHGDEQGVMPTKQKLISSRIDFSIFTEAVLIPLDKNLKPEYDKAAGVEVRLTNAKQKQLNLILDDPNYNNMDDPDGFLEVKFSYKGTDTKEAGQNKYLGVEKEVRKINLEKADDGTYIDKGVQSIAYLLSDTTNDYDLMFSRAGAVSYAQTAQDAEAAMRKYLANNRLLPLFIDFEDEMVARHAQDILDLGCVFNEGSPQYTQLLSLIEENGGNVEEDDSVTKGLQDVTKAKSTKEVEEIVKGDEELQKIADESDEIEDI